MKGMRLYMRENEANHSVNLHGTRQPPLRFDSQVQPRGENLVETAKAFHKHKFSVLNALDGHVPEPAIALCVSQAVCCVWQAGESRPGAVRRGRT